MNDINNLIDPKKDDPDSGTIAHLIPHFPKYLRDYVCEIQNDLLLRTFVHNTQA